MSVLRLRIEKLIELHGAPAPQVFVRIHALAKHAAWRSLSQPVIQCLVPISSRHEDAKLIEVEPGNYYVESTLPSGEILSNQVAVASGESQEVILRAEDSPSQWLSWQHLVGNIQNITPVKSFETPAIRYRDANIRSGRRRTSDRSTRGGDDLLNVNLREPMWWLRDVALHKSVNDDGASLSRWGRLIDSSCADKEGWPLEALTPGPPVEIPPVHRDSENALFSISTSGLWRRKKSSEGRPLQYTSRQFAAVRRPDGLELISLPCPWFGVTDEEADIEVAIKGTVGRKGFCASATPRDEQLGMMLGYLSAGSLPAARQLAETAKEILYYKMRNPFAAAAGAYALVGTAHDADQPWHEWVWNLMNRFPYLPDGAIQWGQLKLRMRRTVTDIEEATRAFKEAYRRGLPFYSMGVRWLLDGLESISRHDPEVDEMLENVRRIAWRSNYQQPFTILRLGGKERV